MGDENVQLTASTVTPPWLTVSVALVNATSVIVSVQFGFGHPGAPGMGVTGPSVMTSNGVLPFLISLAGIDWVPVRVTSAGFCPGASFPPWFVQVAVGVPHASQAAGRLPDPGEPAGSDPREFTSRRLARDQTGASAQIRGRWRGGGRGRGLRLRQPAWAM